MKSILINSIDTDVRTLAFSACQVSIQKTVPILRHPSAPMTNSAVDCADN